MNLAYFANPTLLADIGPAVLGKFLSLFPNDPASGNGSLPALLPDNQIEFEALAQRFADGNLPSRLGEAAVEIEVAASDKLALLTGLLQSVHPPIPEAEEKLHLM